MKTNLMLIALMAFLCVLFSSLSFGACKEGSIGGACKNENGCKGKFVCLSARFQCIAPDACEPEPAKCPSGTDQCLPGYVWREAFLGDHVCVTGATRAQAAQDNAQANSRKDPKCK
ncbi:MAG: hypothetical protein ABL903_14015 [Methylococcales bacterium]